MSLDILLVEDEPDLRVCLEEALRNGDHRVTMALDGEDALAHAQSTTFDVVLCDVRLPRLDGLTLFRRIREKTPSTEVILMTAFAEVADAVAALKEGAYEYLTKPFEIDELMLQIQRIADQRALRRELEQARVQLSERMPDTAIVGQSQGMQRVMMLIDRVAQSSAPVLVTGESGTGKEMVARLLHQRSPRCHRPFIVVNCGALTETLMEAELFGHERGAFTGAIRKRDGRFKAADGGTIFLDEIAELPLSAQAKLLRVLQEGTFEPLGTNITHKVDVRVISATHRNLRERATEGTFREDLFFRVNVIELPLPPLRERAGDLPLLVQHFLRRFTPRDRPVPSIARGAWTLLARHAYPGNVRELSHAIEHAAVLSAGRTIVTAHLPASLVAAASPQSGPKSVTMPRVESLRPLQVALREFEREYLAWVMAQVGGKRVRAAERLGISRKSLWEKLRLYGLSDIVSAEPPAIRND